jgi:hypothetical protein
MRTPISWRLRMRNEPWHEAVAASQPPNHGGALKRCLMRFRWTVVRFFALEVVER